MQYQNKHIQQCNGYHIISNITIREPAKDPLIKMHMEATNYSANTYHVIMRNGKQQYKSGRLVSKSTHHHQRERDYHQNHFLSASKYLRLCVQRVFGHDHRGRLRHLLLVEVDGRFWWRLSQRHRVAHGQGLGRSYNIQYLMQLQGEQKRKNKRIIHKRLISNCIKYYHHQVGF